MATSMTVKIICPDGDPENIRVAEVTAWTGKVFYISRNFWMNERNPYRKNLKVPGVYILVGRNEDSSTDRQTIYVGVSENLCTRIEQHILNPEKSFFESIVCVVGGYDFHNTHFRWMESYLINEATEINKCVLETRNVPAKPYLPDADQCDVKNFLEVAIPIFRLLEIKAFVRPKTIPVKSMKQTTIMDSVEKTEMDSFVIEPLKIMLATRVYLENGKNLTIAECLQCGFWVNGKFEMSWRNSGGAFTRRSPGAITAANYGFAMQDAQTMLVAPTHPPMKELLSKSKYRILEPRNYFKALPDVVVAKDLSGARIRIGCSGQYLYTMALPKKIFESAGFYPP